jgi:hypothetical protein
LRREATWSSIGNLPFLSGENKEKLVSAAVPLPRPAFPAQMREGKWKGPFAGVGLMAIEWQMNGGYWELVQQRGQTTNWGQN